MLNLVRDGNRRPRRRAFLPSLRLSFLLLAVCCLSKVGLCQEVLTWAEVRERFETANPTLKAVQANIDESRAQQITAYLRPNPDLALSADGVQVGRNQGVWRPLSGVLETSSVSYLHERQHKRELRLESA